MGRETFPRENICLNACVPRAMGSWRCCKFSCMFTHPAKEREGKEKEMRGPPCFFPWFIHPLRACLYIVHYWCGFAVHPVGAEEGIDRIHGLFNRRFKTRFVPLNRNIKQRARNRGVLVFIVPSPPRTTNSLPSRRQVYRSASVLIEL